MKFHPVQSIKNIALVFLSLFFVLVLVKGVDIAAARLVKPAALPDEMELLFPPHSEEAFEMAEFNYTVSINSLGLRDREMRPGRGDKVRVVVIGDSFTFGYGVQAEEAWVKKVEFLVQKDGFEVEVVNCGKPGADPYHYAAWAERIIPVLRPDLVVVALLSDDVMLAPPSWSFATRLVGLSRRIFPNLTAVAAARLGGGAAPPMPAYHRSKEENRALNANAARFNLENGTAEQKARFAGLDSEVRKCFLEGNLNPHLVMIALGGPDLYSWWTDLKAPMIKDWVERTGGCLKRIRNIAERHGAKVMALSVPLGVYVNREVHESIKRVGFQHPEGILSTDGPDEIARRACAAAGIPWSTVTPEMRKHVDEAGLYFPLDGHFTAKGHALYAELILPVFEDALRKIPGAAPTPLPQ